MSSFNANFKHKETGLIFRVFCWDDYFGQHNYGYQFPDGEILNENELTKEYERV